jgi:hypothetical protein
MKNAMAYLAREIFAKYAQAANIPAGRALRESRTELCRNWDDTKVIDIGYR